MKTLSLVSVLSLAFLLATPSQANTFSMEDSTIRNIQDTSTGVRLGDYHTSEDKRRLNATAYAHGDLRNAGDLIGAEAQLALRQSFGWLEFGISQTRGKYDRLTNDNPSLGEGGPDLPDTVSTVTSLSVGLSYRSTYIQHFFPDDWFETLGAALTYGLMSEPFRDLSFQGPGLRADFGIHKRLSPSYYWGVKSSYQISSVQTSLENEEEEDQGSLSYSERSLLLHWLTVGVEFGFYF